MTDCPHHRAISSEAPDCILHRTADYLLDVLDVATGGDARAIIVVIDGDDFGHRSLASNLQMDTALHILEREVARLRKALERY